MKKLIIGAVAALALLFGFASCSGDLHDSEVSNLYAEGDMIGKTGETNPRLKFTMTPGSDTEQKLEFTYNSEMTAWGGSKGTVNFKVVRDETGWAKDWGGKQDKNVELSVNDQEWLDLEGRDAANSNPGNIVLKDLAVGNTYTLIVKYDAPNEKLSIKCEGAVTDYPILKAVIVDDTNGKELTDALGKEILLTRSGTDYTSKTFTPTKAGSVTYYLTNGVYYFEDDGEISFDEPAVKITGSWTYDAANPQNYIIYADASAFASDKKITSVIKVNDFSILAKADIIGGFDSWSGSKLTRVDDTTYTYDFTNSGENVEFDIREVAGSWSVGRWFKGIPADTAERKKTDIADDIPAAKYGAAPTSVVLTYYEGDAGEDGQNAKIVGMPYGTGYKFRLTIKIEDASSKKVSVSCQALEDIPAAQYDTSNFDSAYKLNNLKYVCSNYGNYEISWGEKQSDGSYLGTVTIPTGATESWNNKNAIEFGVTDTTSWGTKFTGGTLTTADTYVELEKGNDDNNKIPGVNPSSADVIITIKSTSDSISAKFTK